jgi:hypothetical protein
VLVGAGGATLAIVLSTFVVRSDWIPQWLTAISRLQATSMSNATGWTIARPLASDFVVWSALVVATCVVALFVWWRRTGADVATLVAAALPVSVLAAPHGWSYDYIALVPTVVVGVRAAYQTRVRPIGLAAVAIVATVLPWVMNVVAFGRNGEELSALVLIVAEVLVLGAYRGYSHSGG